VQCCIQEHVQAAPEKMRFEMVIGMEIGILHCHHRSLFKQLI